jgi:hypothetical protein
MSTHHSEESIILSADDPGPQPLQLKAPVQNAKEPLHPRSLAFKKQNLAKVQKEEEDDKKPMPDKQL